ncbi:MAG: hypothetical protein HRT45_07500 [Bdellovibrionales bacterium]|nr:hypothetical protein [Bdellovibrionales bacterium]
MLSSSGAGNCEASAFEPPGSVQLQAQIDYLKTTQADEMANNLQTPTAMRSTRYEEGLNCARGIIESDLAGKTDAEKKSSAYHVMFLSDGIPKTTSNEDVSDLSAILNIVDSIVATGRTASYAAVQPILYGANQLGADLARAQEIMREIARRGTTVEENVDNADAINFCNLLEIEKRTPYTVTDFGIVNLTSVYKDGQLLADSDMDGIPDQEERARGFNPQKTRSGVNGNEIIDGMCKTNASDCSVYDQCGPPNSMGLTQCDVDFLTLTDGLDSDTDGIPDLVEFTRGTLPNTADQNSDIDGDGIINSLEVLRGSDPNRWDRNISSKFKLDYGHFLTDEVTPDCPASQQLWRFDIDYIPIVETVGTRNTDPISSSVTHLNHGAGENIILVYYIIRQANEQSTSSGQLYGQYLKLSSFSIVNLTRFKKLGNINGSFQPEF